LCDNSHRRTNFSDKGILGDGRLIKKHASDGRGSRIIPIVNGPVLLLGEVEIRSAYGNTVYYGSRTAVCRCGHSNNKPFWDDSHAEIDWRDD
jgi:CDGSH-type Zn-finger protein